MFTVSKNLSAKKPVLLSLLLLLFSCALHAQVTYNNTDFNDIVPADIDPMPANIYPSSIVVSGQSGTITSLTVTLHGFKHNFPSGVDILLVAPNGANVILMSDVGGAIDVQNPIEITLDDAASTSLPDNAQLVAGTFKPTNIGAGDLWSSPAPAPSNQTALSTFNGSNPNGTWSLYIVNDDDGSYGSITGWSLTLKTNTTLPVTIASFMASYVEAQHSVLLKWTTANEINSHSFSIETSANGIDWRILGSVKAAGTSNRQQIYQYQDNNPFQGKNYYRLHQLDLDGKTKYSGIVAVNTEMPYNHPFAIYPNPVNSTSAIYFKTPPKEKFSIFLIDMNGKVIQKKQEIISNASTYSLDVQGIKAGMYLLKFLSVNQDITQKLWVTE